MEMVEKIEDELSGDELTSIFCEKKMLKEFDPFYYKKIETLGEGGFGKVERYLDIRDRTMVAVKQISTKKEDKKYMENIASFFVEMRILKRINRENSPNLPKLRGGFYTKNENFIVEKLVIVTEAGDFSLKELIISREKKSKSEGDNNKAAYTPEETLLFLKEIAPGYQTLKKRKIYHSDTKWDNIIFSKEKRTFVIIDYGVSNIINESLSETGVRISSHIRGGTKIYFSPEK